MGAAFGDPCLAEQCLVDYTSDQLSIGCYPADTIISAEGRIVDPSGPQADVKAGCGPSKDLCTWIPARSYCLVSTA
jgi:hypothetical protein